MEERLAKRVELIEGMLRQLPFVSPQRGSTEPSLGAAAPGSDYLVNGLMAFADGSSWDPGQGAGFYWYDSTQTGWRRDVPSIDPLNYGAVYGSGVSSAQKTANTTALQNCLNSGFNVNVSGLLYTDGSVTIVAGVRLWGDTPLKCGIFCNHASSPTLTDTATVAGGAGATQNVMIERLWIKSDNSDALRISPYQWHITDNFFQAANGKGIYVVGNGYQVENYFERNYFYGCYQSFFAPDGPSYGPSDNFFYDNTFWSNGISYNHFLGENMAGWTIRGNHFYGTLVGVGSFDFVDGDVSTGDDTITETAHGLKTGDTVYLTTTGTLPAGLSGTFHYHIIRVDANTFKLATTAYNAIQGTNVNITAAAGGGTHTVNKAGAHIYMIAGPVTRIMDNYFEPGGKLRFKMGVPSCVIIMGNDFWDDGTNDDPCITAWNFQAGTSRSVVINGNGFHGGSNIDIISTDIANTDGFFSSQIEIGRNEYQGTYNLRDVRLNIELTEAMKFPYRNSGAVDFYYNADATYAPYIIFDGSAAVIFNMLANSNALHRLTRWLDNRSAYNVTIGSSGAKTMVGHTTVAPGERVAIHFDKDDDAYYVHLN